MVAQWNRPTAARSTKAKDFSAVLLGADRDFRRPPGMRFAGLNRGLLSGDEDSISESPEDQDGQRGFAEGNATLSDY